MSSVPTTPTAAASVGVAMPARIGPSVTTVSSTWGSIPRASWPNSGPSRVVRSAELLADLRPDLLKLEWPGDAAGCEELSKVCGSVPWTLLSAGVAYEAFVERVLTALDAGASGYIAGRAFWGEAVNLTGAERQEFLRTVAADRMAGLNAAIEGHGRSWREAT